MKYVVKTATALMCDEMSGRSRYSFRHKLVFVRAGVLRVPDFPSAAMNQSGAISNWVPVCML
jgi:hypothetical protein